MADPTIYLIGNIAKVSWPNGQSFEYVVDVAAFNWRRHRLRRNPQKLVKWLSRNCHTWRETGKQWKENENG